MKNIKISLESKHKEKSSLDGALVPKTTKEKRKKRVYFWSDEQKRKYFGVQPGASTSKIDKQKEILLKIGRLFDDQAQYKKELKSLDVKMVLAVSLATALSPAVILLLLLL